MAKHPIQFGVQTPPQNVSFERLLEFWPKVDSWGYDSLWVFDHFYPIFGDSNGPCLESWTLLSALSQHTRHARIGTLVNSNTYRHPCVVAKMAATVDQMSGGRLNLGLGAGWFEVEHRSFGLDFKPVPQRLAALEEAVQIIRGMFSQERTTLHGRHYQVTDAVCNPKPLQAHVPLMIGGLGERVLLKIVARHADMWNTAYMSPAQIGRLISIIERHGDVVGRDTDEIDKSVMLPLCYQASAARERTLTERAAAIKQTSLEQARDLLLIGGRQECLDRIEAYIQAGVTHFIFTQPFPNVVDEELQAFAEEIIPVVRGR